MALTTQQAATLKTDIQARANLNAFVAAADWPSVAIFYNGVASPTVQVWKPAVTINELNSAINWTSFVTTGIGKQTAFLCMTQNKMIDATDSQVRGGIAQIFAGDSTSINALTAVSQRPATYFEALFSVASGAAQVSTFYGQNLQPLDVQHAMGF